MTDIDRAQQLLDDPLLGEAFRETEKGLTELWKSTAEDQERERERLWVMIKMLHKVRGHLEGAIRTGRFEAARQQEGDVP